MVGWHSSRGRSARKRMAICPRQGKIFFDCRQNIVPDHVGIVEKVEGGVIYTIERTPLGIAIGKTAIRWKVI